MGTDPGREFAFPLSLAESGDMISFLTQWKQFNEQGIKTQVMPQQTAPTAPEMTVDQKVKSLGGIEGQLLASPAMAHGGKIVRTGIAIHK